MKKYWGFNLETIDPSVRPQDDFYRYANGKWLKTTTIPEDESSWGTFSILRYETEKQLKKIIEILKEKRQQPEGTSEQMVSDLYASAIDNERRNTLGIEPLRSLISEIENINSPADIVAYVAHTSCIGFGNVWGLYVGQDAKESSRYLLHFSQGGLGMPDREYYLSDAPEQKRIREAYQLHIAKLMELLGKPREEAARIIRAVMNIETRLAKASMSKEDNREVEKTYHKFSLEEFSNSAPGIDPQRFITLLGVGHIQECIVRQPNFFKDVSNMVVEIPITEWKAYFEFQLINDSAVYLSRPFVEEDFDFYRRTLIGQNEMKPDWRRALGTVSGALGEALGVLYVKEYFNEKAKQRMDTIVDDLFAAYQARIMALEWMSSETKQKALGKLRRIVRKIGYPSRLKGYAGLEIRSDDFFGNIVRVTAYELRRAIEKLEKPIDREEWFMDPQDVNAYFDEGMNDIVFPAAILQPPFFDSVSEDEAVNYAAIGAVIGHELTHGFDDQGSKFDEEGNMNNWWTKEDKKRFEEKTKILVNQFNTYEVAPGIFVNGQLCLGENIADLGGVTIAFAAYQKHLESAGREDIDGLTPEKRFFFGFAQAERARERIEYLKTIVAIDVHSPAEFRVNGPLSNFEEFYKAFSVTEGDTLYRQPKERAKIW